MRKRAAVALLLVPLLLASLPAEGAARKDRCRVVADGFALARTRTVLVAQRADTVYACRRPDGRRYVLGEDDGLYHTLSIDVVGRRTVTYTESYTPECKADCPPGTTGSTTASRIDLRTGRITPA